MKKLVLLFCSLFLITFVSCKNLPVSNKVDDIDLLVASEIENLDKNYSDETLKALSVLIRTNLSINATKSNNSHPGEKYRKLTYATKGQVLKNQKGNLVEIGFESHENYSWQKIIKKSKVLEFALKNNISLTNLSNISPIMNGDRVAGLEIGNKYFDYDSLAEKFGLESNIIDSISQTKTEIIIKGKNKGFYGYFDPKISEQLSNNNYFYEDILGYFFDNLSVIKN